jgi:hypothetical protein
MTASPPGTTAECRGPRWAELDRRRASWRREIAGRRSLSRKRIERLDEAILSRDGRHDSDHRRMPRAEDPVAARQDHERAVADLVGRRVFGVTYWDIHDFGNGRDWDFGDWHLAVMGVELTTDRGPVTVTWGNTFYPWGAELWPYAFSEGAVRADDGPDGWARPIRTGSRGSDHRCARRPWSGCAGKSARGTEATACG